MKKFNEKETEQKFRILKKFRKIVFTNIYEGHLEG